MLRGPGPLSGMLENSFKSSNTNSNFTLTLTSSIGKDSSKNYSDLENKYFILY